VRVSGAIAIVVASGLATWSLWPAATTLSHTLAVLPFDNTAKDEDLDYLCEGVAESLIQHIVKLQTLRVSTLSTVLSFKGQGVDPAGVGRQLGVETILAGTLERQGARLQISARLLDVASGRQLWANKYDREARDLLGVQDDIASAIMGDGLRVRLTADQRQQLVRHPTTDGDAYDFYLQSRYSQRRATEDDYLFSRELLQKAIVRDPKFALAYASLGRR
jgi:non-specific serine/threonine protein kinase